MSTIKRTSGRQISLARALSKFGIASRTQAQEMILRGSVSVNGRACRNPNVWIDPVRDRVVVGGKALRPRQPVCWLMHKPVGLVTTRSDELGRKTVFDLLPADHRHLFPIGRLDKDTSGALLLTNITPLGELLTSPETKVPKEYLVTIDRPLEVEDRDHIARGLTLRDGTRLQPVGITGTDAPRVYRMILHEGKNRQIRRMCELLGYTVEALHRERIGSIRLGSLKPGEVRQLTKHELDELLRNNDRTASTQSAGKA